MKIQHVLKNIYIRVNNNPVAAVGIFMLIGAIIFNLYLYRIETRATIDPNDNAFQYALVDRTNQIWDYAKNNCPKNITYPICHISLLIDHWVPNWAEGYNLPYYYSHIPQIAIVTCYRFLTIFFPYLNLFWFYHFVIYILLCIFPISVYFALYIIGRNHLLAGLGAIISTHLSTDGLYGLDPSSFLWRGYGLSSQLFAMIFLPPAITLSYKYISSNFTPNGFRLGSIILSEVNSLKIFNIIIGKLLHKNNLKNSSLPNLNYRQYIDGMYDTNHNSQSYKYYIWSVLFLVLTTAGHLGLGIMALMSVGAISVGFIILAFLSKTPSKLFMEISARQIIRTSILGISVIFILSYWIIPVLTGNDYHNISVWDPIWKFNSYGFEEVIKNFLNGKLLDFDRLQIITVFTIIGFFITFWNSKLMPIGILLPFWILLYFGRTTWGSLIDLIPGMKEFHISRFIVGVHLSALILAPIAIEFTFQRILKFINKLIYPFLSKEMRNSNTHNHINNIIFCIFLIIYLFILIPPLTSRAIEYNSLNEELINKAVVNHTLVKDDEKSLFDILRALPAGRVFAGRGGGWGKDFLIAETPYYMNLSTYGIPTVLWLPETWSPNSDVEQYFIEEEQYTYDLFNIKYVVTPKNKEPLSFWKYITEKNNWKLYEVSTSGYFTTGTMPSIVSSDKQSFANVVRLYIQSDYPKNFVFPNLTFDKSFPKNTGLPNFKMLDEVTYITPDQKLHNIFSEKPIYNISKIIPKLLGNETNNYDMQFSTKVVVPEGCVSCGITLKQTFHPNWQVSINGIKVKNNIVFPFYNSVKLENAGEYTVSFTYEPSPIKISFAIITLIVLVIICILNVFKKTKINNNNF